MKYTDCCTQFIGSMPVVSTIGEKNVFSLFYNPCCSDVSVSLEAISFINLSSEPVRIEAFVQPEICGELCKSEDIIPRDLNCLNKVESSVELCYGVNVQVKDGYRIATLVVPPYTTNAAPLRIPATMPPGTARGYVFTSLGELNTISVSVIYDWAEN